MNTEAKVIADALRAAARKAGIRLKYASDCPTAAVAWKDDHYLVVMNAAALADPAMELAFLRHELSHVARGDCLVLLRNQGNPEFRAQRWNVAADALINTPAILEPLAERGINGVDYSALRQGRSLPPKHAVTTEQLYDLLGEQGESDGGDGSGRASDSPEWPEPFDEHSAEGDPAEAGKRHAAAVKKLQRALREAAASGDLPDSAREAIEEVADDVASAAGVSGQSRRAGPSQYPPPAPIPPLVGKVLAALRGIGGHEEWAPSYHRERRGYEGRPEILPGYSYAPRPNIVLLIDASGSMAPYVDQVAALVAALARRYTLHVIVHDHDIVYEGQTLPPAEVLQSGGGTEAAPAWRAAKRRRPDAVIHITDGELYPADVRALLPLVAGTRAIWLLTTGRLPPDIPGLRINLEEAAQ